MLTRTARGRPTTASWLRCISAGLSGTDTVTAGAEVAAANGFTGRYNVQPPTDEQIREWCETRGNDGIAFVLQDGEVINQCRQFKGEWPAGTGAATMADARECAGCDLPPGPKLRNRTDGSEKRPFRVQTGLKFKKSLGPCVDVITPTHRYVNAGTNPDTGNAEQWFDADDNLLNRPPDPRHGPNCRRPGCCC